MIAKGAKHPSGRPISHTECRSLPVFRIPDDGPVIPRLKHHSTDAIGFHHIIAQDEADEREDYRWAHCTNPPGKRA